MASLDTITSPEQLKSECEKMDEGQLLAQEIAQKGALHAVDYAIGRIMAGQHPLPLLRQMKASITANAEVITGVCKARGVTTIDV